MGTALRIAKTREGVGTRKNLSEFDAFMKEWRDGLKGRGKAWGEIQAVAELKRRGMLEFLMAEGGSENGRATRHLFKRMFHEIQSYKKELAGSLLKDRFDRVDKSLRSIAERIQAEERLANDRVIEEILQRLRANVHQARGALTWSKITREKLHFGFSPELLWSEVPKKGLVSRRMELDTRLQVELGKSLLFYLWQKRVSLETVARLVVLAYWAGGLSEISGVFTKSRLTGRVLKVRNIRDNLRRAKLHEAEVFKLDRTPALTAELQRAKKILGPASSGIGVLPRLYLSEFAKRFGLTKQQMTGLISQMLDSSPAKSVEWRKGC
jgi:hypothetical protein